jgi:Kdo2-lipid IVA lauroyltransferase/acyltransferase
MSAPALTLPQKLRYGAEAAAFLAFMGFFRLLGLDAASAVGGFIGRNIFALTSASRRARRNLAMAFPEKSEAERDAIIRVMWDNLGRTVAEYAHLDKLGVHGADPHITVKGGEILASMRGRGVLILSGHFANWEAMPITGAQYGLQGAIVYRPPNNPYVDRYISRARAIKGYAEQISKHKGVKRIFTLLRGGKAILLLADQKTNEGIPVPFFGRDAMTTPAPAALALKLNVPVVLAANKRLSDARFCVTIYPPLDFTPTGNEEADTLALTLAINRKLEEIVRADPGQWLWIHRRWPTPRDVTTGKRV